MAADQQPQVRALPRMPRLVDEVVSNLRDSIVQGALPAGTTLTQVGLAEQFGVSRTPLREALRVLESEGLIRTTDNSRKVEVVSVGPGTLRQMYEFREVIDGLAARLAAANGFLPDEAQRSEELLRQMEESSEPYDPVLRNKTHSAFHELIASASRNSKVQSFAPLIRSSSAALYLPLNREHAAINLLAEDPTRPYKHVLDQAQAQHREIVEAILARDPETAEAAARRHIQRTIRMIPNFA
jgi:GntR family transcriptional regulator, vanillate catabolism transcriptional regulator